MTEGFNQFAKFIFTIKTLNDKIVIEGFKVLVKF